ncbi:pentatricopeptide repeat-containing protein At2g20540-like [Bidens hawaiensis]|uniref:pentatricopeptide repeat-containing protein At2g20540-like n=1 Tax=Bidens hawaiensis TaxID=980011 RepID=UPI00404B6AF6
MTCLNHSNVYNNTNPYPPSRHLQMIRKTVKPSSTFTIKTLSQTCKTLTQFKQLHAQLLKSHQFQNTYIYNTIIQSYTHHNYPIPAILTYTQMLNFGIVTNNYTYPPLIKACLNPVVSNWNSIGWSVHVHVLKLGFSGDRYVGSALIEFYSAGFEIESARKVFDEMPVKDVVIWTGLLDGYGKVEDVESARNVFDEMPERTVVSWSAILAAYSQVSEFNEVVSLFLRMQEAGVRANESVLVTVVTACAHLGALAQGVWVHLYAKRRGLDSNTILATALVDMYLKCGYPDLALSVFETILVKDTGAWNAIISGLAMNGEARKSIELLNRMETVKIKPSEATFVAILTACTHTKMVNEGVELFDRMGRVYGVEPRFEHYACMVDLFARSGMLREAVEFAEGRMGGFGGMDANVWGALLSACRVYGNVEVGNKVWRKLVDMKVVDYGVYVMCYNMFKEAGWKQEAEEVRKMIVESGMKKTPGCSVIEVDGAVKEFVSGETGQPWSMEVRKVLDSLFNVARVVELS